MNRIPLADLKLELSGAGLSSSSAFASKPVRKAALIVFVVVLNLLCLVHDLAESRRIASLYFFGK